MKEKTMQKTSDEDTIDLRDFLSIISRYRWMVILVCTVAVVPTAILSIKSEDMYAATTSIFSPLDLMAKEAGLGGLGGAYGTLLRNAMHVVSFAGIYASILESDVVLDALVDKFDLMKAYDEHQYRSKVRAKLLSRTDIQVSGEGVLTIIVEDEDPTRAAAIANMYVEELDRQNKRMSSGQATSKRVFLENRLAEIKQELSGIVDLSIRDATVKEMIFELLTREYEIAKIEEAKSLSTIQILDKAIVPELRLPKGTFKKAAIAGMMSIMLSVSVVYMRECSKRWGERHREVLHQQRQM